MTGEEPPTLSSAGASNASTLCETPGGALPAPEDAPPANDTAVGSAQGGASPIGDGDAMPPPRPPVRVGEASRTSTSTSTSPPTRPPHSSTTRSPRFPTPPRPLPPTSLPALRTDDSTTPAPRSASPSRSPQPPPSVPVPVVAAAESPRAPEVRSRARTSPRTRTSRSPPVTPATALSVLPLHAAVAAGDVDEVRRWLDVHAPVLKPSDAADAPDKASSSTPEWPPRPVRDILGPSSESREAPDPGAFHGRTSDPLARPGSGFGREARRAVGTRA